MKTTGKVKIIVIFVFVVIALFTIGPRFTARDSYALQGPQESGTAEQIKNAADLSRAFEHVADIIKPSVVNISSVQRIQMSQRRDELFNSPFRDFFGDDFFERFFDVPQHRDHIRQGLGTGVVVSQDGFILTNNHVVSDADEVTVRLTDEREFTAEVVGTDEKTDLAVIRIEADDLIPATLGDSERIKVGEWVVAAGNPFGLESTITSGIVSAKGRSRVGISEYEDFIQTDAAINPGNSGGPLVNLEGQVVGINTAIFTRSGGYMGIGFAIPINMARSIMNSLIEEGRVVRGWLGVTIQDLNEDLSSSFGYDGTEGVLIGDVVEDGPADEAGFRSGDILTRFHGKKVEDMQQLRSRVADTKPGTDVAVQIFRDGRFKKLNVEIGELQTDMSSQAKKSTSEDVDLGMSVRTVTPEIARQLGYDGDMKGVVVTDVAPLGPAAKGGIQVRDVIVKVQDEPVADMDDFRHLLKENDLEKGVRLVVFSGDSKHFVFIKADE
jgi:serine protease Do